MNTKQAAIGRWSEIFKYYGLPGITGKTISRRVPSMWSQRQIPL
jgi:hypothetical protein